MVKGRSPSMKPARLDGSSSLTSIVRCHQAANMLQAISFISSDKLFTSGR